MMPVSVNSNVTLVLLDRKDKVIAQYPRMYSDVSELSVIFKDGKTYVFGQQRPQDWSRIFFKEAKVTLDLNEVKGTVELKADPVLDARDLQEVLALLQFNEISLIRTLAIVQDWANGCKPLSSDLPVKSVDNPLIDSDECAMDVLRRVREDIVVGREQDVQDAALIAAFLSIHSGHLPFNWANDLAEIVERLTADAHGKPVSENLKAKYTIKVGHPMFPRQLAGLRLAEGAMAPEFIFRVNEDNILTEEQKAEGMEQDFIPGVGPVIRMPIKPDSELDTQRKELIRISIKSLEDMGAGVELAMKQFSDNVRAHLEKFRTTR